MRPPAKAFRPFAGWPRTDGWASALEANRPALDRWARASDTMAKAMLMVSQEMTRPAQATPEEDVQSRESPGHGHNLNEVSDRQHRFAEAATARYLDESSDLTALMTKIANQGFNAPTRGKEIDT